ncbi:hypothetical protein L345_03749, partial [Ophiophagus hannah]
MASQLVHLPPHLAATVAAAPACGINPDQEMKEQLWISACGFKPAWPNACAGEGSSSSSGLPDQSASGSGRVRCWAMKEGVSPLPLSLEGPSGHFLKPIAFLNSSLLPFVCKCTLLFPTQRNSAFFYVPGRGL